MASTITPMTLGEIFDRTFSLIGKTFWRNAAISLSFLIIPIVLLTLSAHHFYSSLPDFTSGTTPKDLSYLGPMFAGTFYFGTASLLLAVAAMLAEIAISIVISGEINSEQVDYPTAVKMTFDRRWLNGIGEGVLKTLALVGVSTFAAILGGIIVLSLEKGSGASSALLILFTVLFILIIVAAIFFFLIRLYFALTAVAVQDIGPIEALKKSWFLVGGHWWRTLGILVLFFILSGFAVSIITLPVTFGSMWNSYKHFFTMMGQTKGRVAPEQLHRLQTALGPMIGISTGLSSTLSLMITPVFTVVMYFDLRARHNDLPSPENAAAGENIPPVTII